MQEPQEYLAVCTYFCVIYFYIFYFLLLVYQCDDDDDAGDDNATRHDKQSDPTATNIAMQHCCICSKI